MELLCLNVELLLSGESFTPMPLQSRCCTCMCAPHPHPVCQSVGAIQRCTACTSSRGARGAARRPSSRAAAQGPACGRARSMRGIRQAAVVQNIRVHSCLHR